MRKEVKPAPNSWMGFLAQVKEVVGIEMQRKHYSTAMSCYINSVGVERCVEKIKEDV